MVNKKDKIISIDQGTSSTRSVLYDENGHLVDAVQEEFEQIFPDDGWVEHNPEQSGNLYYPHLRL